MFTGVRPDEARVLGCVSTEPPAIVEVETDSGAERSRFALPAG
jgi:hypothetical protein